jgi:signal peptidase I
LVQTMDRLKRAFVFSAAQRRGALEAAGALGAALLFSLYVGSPGVVQGASMLPTFPACCSVVWFSHVFRRDRLRVGDVVSASVAGQERGEEAVGVVKRVRGVAGDVVLDEMSGRAVVVPAEHVWLLGDNASDSRGSFSCPVDCVDLTLRRLAALWAGAAEEREGQSGVSALPASRAAPGLPQSELQLRLRD